MVDQLKSMRSVAVCVFSVLVLSACEPVATSSTSVAPTQAKTLASNWRFTCIGGAGATAIPVFWHVDHYNPQTGEIDATLKDRDGISGGAPARMVGNEIEMFNERTPMNENWTKFTFSVPYCPGGFVGEAL